MTRFVKRLSYLFAAMAGVCFVSGLAVLSEGGGTMETLESTFLFLDYLTDTKRKRHMVGGILMSVSLFFGGLAFTMMTIKGDIDNEQDRA